MSRLETRSMESNKYTSKIIVSTDCLWKLTFNIILSSPMPNCVNYRSIYQLPCRGFFEYACWDLKDGELCMSELKPS